MEPLDFIKNAKLELTGMINQNQKERFGKIMKYKGLTEKEEKRMNRCGRIAYYFAILWVIGEAFVSIIIFGSILFESNDQIRYSGVLLWVLFSLIWLITIGGIAGIYMIQEDEVFEKLAEGIKDLHEEIFKEKYEEFRGLTKEELIHKLIFTEVILNEMFRISEEKKQLIFSKKLLNNCIKGNCLLFTMKTCSEYNIMTNSCVKPS
jgi:ABC-type transport system involved in multi-copper enzyme maturation permease subunit